MTKRVFERLMRILEVLAVPILKMIGMVAKQFWKG